MIGKYSRTALLLGCVAILSPMMASAAELEPGDIIGDGPLCPAMPTLLVN